MENRGFDLGISGAVRRCQEVVSLRVDLVDQFILYPLNTQIFQGLAVCFMKDFKRESSSVVPCR